MRLQHFGRTSEWHGEVYAVICCFPCKIMSKVMEHYSVRINGIQSRPELNGQIGKLSGEPTGSGRSR